MAELSDTYLSVFLFGPVSPVSGVDEVTQQCDVWFLDRSLYWHYLTPSFTAYYRLMITHLGLPEWQYNFTPYGPSPQAKVRGQRVRRWQVKLSSIKR